MSDPRFAFVASRAPEGQAALADMTARYGNHPPTESDVIVALGGDGFMLQTLHKLRAAAKPVFGMKTGTVGFLMNLYRAEDLADRIESAQPAKLHPLRMTATSESGHTAEHLAFNEVSLLRQTRQAAKLKVFLNDKERLEELVCDGALVSTPAGSTAYNLSAHGPILPLGSGVVALTHLAAFRPLRWRGAILRNDVRIKFEVQDHYKRPVSATADSHEVRDIVEVEIEEAHDITLTLLFDAEHSLEERILDEQFVL